MDLRIILIAIMVLFAIVDAASISLFNVTVEGQQVWAVPTTRTTRGLVNVEIIPLSGSGGGSSTITRTSFLLETITVKSTGRSRSTKPTSITIDKSRSTLTKSPTFIASTTTSTKRPKPSAKDTKIKNGPKKQRIAVAIAVPVIVTMLAATVLAWYLIRKYRPTFIFRQPKDIQEDNVTRGRTRQRGASQAEAEPVLLSVRFEDTRPLPPTRKCFRPRRTPDSLEHPIERPSRPASISPDTLNLMRLIHMPQSPTVAPPNPAISAPVTGLQASPLRTASVRFSDPDENDTVLREEQRGRALRELEGKKVPEHPRSSSEYSRDEFGNTRL